MEVTALCSKFIQKFHVSVANVVQMRPLDFIMREKSKFALVGNNMVTLKEFEKQEKAKAEGSGLRMARSRSPQTARAPPPAPWKQQEMPKRRSARAPGHAADRAERGPLPGAPHEDLVAELQQTRGGGVELHQGDRGAALLLERGGRREGRVCRQGHRHHGLRGCGARVLREGSADGGQPEVDGAAAALGGGDALAELPVGPVGVDGRNGRLGAYGCEGRLDGERAVLAGVRELRGDRAGAGDAGPVRTEAVRAGLREGAHAVCGEAAWAREGDDAADEVVARPAGVVVRAYDAVGLRAGVDRHLRRAAVRQGGAGADDRELHVAAREVRPAPRRVVELLRPERCLVAVDVAEAALDGPGEPLHERGGSAGLRRPRAHVVRVVDALLLVRWRWMSRHVIFQHVYGNVSQRRDRTCL